MIYKIFAADLGNGKRIDWTQNPGRSSITNETGLDSRLANSPCSESRAGPRALGLWSCLDVGTRAMTPAAQAIWRSIRPMVNKCLPQSLVAPPGLHEMAFFAPRSLAYARLLGRASDPAFRGERPVEPCSEDSSFRSDG